MRYELKIFLQDAEERNLSPRTIKGYKNNIGLFIDHCEQNEITNINEVTKAHIQYYLNQKSNNGLSPAYINGLHKVLRAFFKFLAEEEYIEQNPTLGLKWKKEEKKVKQIMNNKQIKDIISYYDCDIQDDNFLYIRNKTVIMLQIDTGIRNLETCTIKLADLFDDRILIHGKGNKQRMVYISPPMKKQLNRYLRARNRHIKDTKQIVSDALFISKRYKPLTIESVENIYRDAVSNISSFAGKKITPHNSRHTFATNMVQDNDIYTVSKLLGHSKVSITEIYLGTLDSDAIINRGNIKSPLDKLK